jgi:hypothetical protein
MMIGDIASWRTYAADRGNDAPTNASDTDATAALTRASDYITHHYVRRFLTGYDATSDYVEEAAYEAATLELATPGFFSKTFTEGQQKVLTGIDSIKWTPIKSDAKSVRSGMLYAPTSTIIDAMLSEYMPLDRGIGPYIKSIGGQNE